LPHLLQLQEKYPQQLLAVTWNLDHNDANSDPPDSLAPSVLEKLTALNMTTRNVISSDPMDNVLSHYGIFGLPAAIVFGRDGQVVHVFEGAFSYDTEVEPLVTRLLADSEGP
jgi:hypothetical protein